MRRRWRSAPGRRAGDPSALNPRRGSFAPVAAARLGMCGWKEILRKRVLTSKSETCNVNNVSLCWIYRDSRHRGGSGEGKSSKKTKNGNARARRKKTMRTPDDGNHWAANIVISEGEERAGGDALIRAKLWDLYRLIREKAPTGELLIRAVRVGRVTPDE